ncbi:MAG: molybdopterin-dependent oxidoreductase [Acidobacteriales bacterium]|nr:molybdopterin-dependent oxidoreductase [Terriglobales bacterium]
MGFYAVVLLCLTVTTQCLEAQQITVAADSGKITVLERSDIERLPHVKFNESNSAGSSVLEGVALRGVLEKAGVRFGESLKGKRLASCLMIEGRDGYRVLFALPELDAAFTSKQVLLVFLRNGKPLVDDEGPYRIAVPDETRKARWVRQVKRLSILEVL